ncbi:MAG: mandelate racemase/muconate lactonizing enzyme family protein [Deltaproteobacteria bacterium]|nr:mandelate racemase/muconate lactonizing enzyme family protein [Deltaproteobacteria bacterium]
MKISRVETIPIKQELKEPFGNAQGWTTARQYLIVRITADDGTVGYGECWGPIAGNHQVVKDIITPMLLGEDPLDTSVLWEKIHFKLRWAYHSFAPYSALSGIDIALWDLKGKLLELPVHKLLGGTFRDRVLAYATGHYFRNVDTIEQQIAIIEDEARSNLAKGFRMLKLKIGLALLGWGTKEDILLMEAFRRTLGDDIDFMIDANCAYTIPEALEVGRSCEQLGIYWFEEPVPPHDYDGYAFLSSKLDVPIAGGEGWALVSEFNEVFKRRAVSYAQPDVCSAGGITEVQRIAALAQAVNIDCIPHAWGTPIAIASSLHVLANKPGKALLEFDQSDNPIREHLVEDPFRLEGQYVRVPTGPGLGITIDEKMLDKFRIDT